MNIWLLLAFSFLISVAAIGIGVLSLYRLRKLRKKANPLDFPPKQSAQ